MKASYVVKRSTGTVGFENGWSAGQWEGVNILELKYHMGDRPRHFPKTQAKLLYDDGNLYVFFRVEDRYVRCTVDKMQGDVCHDSCVEFFFAPEEGTGPGSNYFNLEANCGGTILFNCGHPLRDPAINDRHRIDPADLEQVEVHASLPGTIDPEIAEPTTWTLGCKLPFGIVEKYSGAERPQSGIKWSANFYKCADKTSHPHWLTWAPVDNPAPKFHLPQFFGALEFE
ncbi:MAG: carbohydrate-binding family 9-like protein [Verrucomicrobiota bacterium]